MAKSNSGFSLVGVLIAALIVATGSMAAVGLVVRADQATEGARDKFIATQIAREGLELVRARRDANWLARTSEPHRSWLQDLCDRPGETNFTGTRVGLLDEAMIRNQSDMIEVDPANVSVGVLYVIPITAPRGGEWTHQTVSGATSSRWRRVLSLDCASRGDGVVRVTSLVRWNSRFGEQRVILKEELYDWFP